MTINHDWGPPRVVRRASAVIGPQLDSVRRALSLALKGSSFLRDASADAVCPVLGCYYASGCAPARYRARVQRWKRRVLTIELDANGRILAGLTSEHFYMRFMWTLFDAMIDLGGRRGYDINSLAKARSVLFVPTGPNAFEGALSANKNPAQPDDPFKVKVELRVPIAPDLFGHLDRFEAVQRLDSVLDEALDCRDLGMLESTIIGGRQARFMLVGTDAAKILKAIRTDVVGRRDDLHLPSGTYALVRRAGSRGKVKRVTI